MRHLYHYADLAHLPADPIVSWPTCDPDPPPDGCDGRTRAMLSAMAEASFDALGFEEERAVPVDVAMRRRAARNAQEND